MRDVFDIKNWSAQGACRRQPTELWFTSRRADTERARTICDTCPVQTECRAHAMARPALLGIWAGTTPQERSTMRARESLGLQEAGRGW
jgi:WhiB family redox-sensing transcriptional regulator